MENNKKISKLIDELEKVSVLLEVIGNISNLQLDYIDFQEYKDNNAILTLNELMRTKSEHVTLGHILEEKVKEADKQVQKVLHELYKESGKEQKEKIKEDIEKELISYYDLLTLLKDNKQPKEIILHYDNNQKLSYKYDEENGYIIKDAKRYFRDNKLKNNFDFYLSNTFLDSERFNNQIEVKD